MRNNNSAFSDPNIFVSCPGSRIHIERSPKLRGDGSIALIESGSRDIDFDIQREVPLTDIHYIISRIEAGDNSVVRTGGAYGDFTKFPSNNIEALNAVLNAEKEFNRLDLSIREKFGHDYMKWLAAAGSDMWYANMGIMPKNDSAAVVDRDVPIVKDVQKDIKE